MVDNEHTDLDALFAALSDRTRRAILLMLLEKDMTVRGIADPFDTSLAAVSKHIQILVKSGIVTQTKLGREKWCRLNSDSLKPAAFWIESYGQFLDDSFDLLEKAIEEQSQYLDKRSD